MTTVHIKTIWDDGMERVNVQKFETAHDALVTVIHMGDLLQSLCDNKDVSLIAYQVEVDDGEIS